MTQPINLSAKPNRRQQIANFLLGKKEGKTQEDFMELPLAGNAVRVNADRKLRERFEEWENAMKILRDNPIPEDATLYQYCDHLLDIFDSIKMIVQRIAYAYMRAGDKENKEEKQVMYGWTKLFGIYRARLLRHRLFWGTNEPFTNAKHRYQSTDAITIHKFSMDCDNILFPITDLVITMSFKDIDVRPTSVTVVTGFFPPRGYQGYPSTMNYPKPFNGETPPPQNWGDPRYATETKQQ